MRILSLFTSVWFPSWNQTDLHVRFIPIDRLELWKIDLKVGMASNVDTDGPVLDYQRLGTLNVVEISNLESLRWSVSVLVGHFSEVGNY